MPRPKKSEAVRKAELRRERFSECYRVGKARMNLMEPHIAAAVGIAESTMRRYKQNPGELFSISQLEKLGSLLGWTDEDYLAIIHAKK